MRTVFSKISYANVVSTLALFIALGGTAVATGLLDGKKIKPGSITGKQIKHRSVPGSDLKPDSVRGRQILERSLRKVPRASRADEALTSGSANIAASAETAATATVANGLSAQLLESLTDSCPSGTIAYAGVCIDETSRESTVWPTAAKVCGDAGARLPHLSEMEGFRQLPGITYVGYEHTGAYLDLNGLNAGGEFTVGISDGGGLAPGYDYGGSNAKYRCVFPASNR